MREDRKEMHTRRYGAGGARTQVRFRIEGELLNELRLLARSKRVTLNRLVEEIFEETFRPLSEASQVRVISDSIADIRNELQTVHYELEYFAEAFGFYVYQWMCSSPSVPEPQQKAAMVRGKDRYRKFLSILKNRVVSGNYSLVELLRDEVGEDKESSDLIPPEKPAQKIPQD